jgi:hypothetical protein
MPENQWTEDDFVQLARPKMLAAADPTTLLLILFEFFSEALLHYDNATAGGKAYLDKAMGGLTGLFVAERDDPDTAEATNMKVAIRPLESLLTNWRDSRSSTIVNTV